MVYSTSCSSSEVNCALRIFVSSDTLSALSERVITPDVEDTSLVTTIYLSACDSLLINGCEFVSIFGVSSSVPWGSSTTRCKVTLSVMFLYRSMAQVFSSTSATLHGPVDISTSLFFGSSVGLNSFGRKTCNPGFSLSRGILTRSSN